MDFKLELVALPVTDVDRAIAFYTGLGFTLDHDHTVSDEMRFVQITPPGSACSIAFGTGITDAPPVEGLQVVVEDADAARAYLQERGVDAPEVVEFPWGRFTYFQDPDGNGWACQQMVPQG
jgi:catechol 2,3-dioxygenase-like lactoylglutathione lyase family enzyme